MNSKRIFLYVVCLICSAFTTSFFFGYIVPQGTISFEIESSIQDKLQVFWGMKSNNYTEEDSVVVVLKDARQNIIIDIPDLKKIKTIRFDPNTTESVVKIYHITLNQKWIDPIIFNSVDTFKKIIPINGIGILNLSKDAIVLSVTDNDPQLEIIVYPQVHIYRYLVFFLVLVTNTFFLVLIFYLFMNSHKWFSVVKVVEVLLVVSCMYMFSIYFGKQFHFTTLFIKELFNEFVGK